MRILICDDEQKLIDLELSILQEYCRSTNIAATFFTFTDSLSAGNIGEFDIAFLDIDMEKLNGIELARKLRSKNPTSIIIFVTNFIQYAPEGYEVNAFRYLLKSILCEFATRSYQFSANRYFFDWWRVNRCSNQKHFIPRIRQAYYCYALN